MSALLITLVVYMVIGCIISGIKNSPNDSAQALFLMIGGLVLESVFVAVLYQIVLFCGAPK